VGRALGKYERLAYERDTRDHAGSRGFFFDATAAEHPITFIESLCRHHKGEWAGKPLLLEDWQKRIIRAVFGWKRADGSRRYRIAYIEVPRKNGKSELAAALGLYLLVADHEPGAEVYSSATKKDQAKIVHDTATAMVKASPELKRFVKVFRNNLHVPRLGSKFEPLGADSNTLDGLNPHGNIVDELHAHKDRGVWDVLDTAMGARRQPLTLAITTAGVYESESIGWLQHEHAVKVLEGVVEDDAFFAFVAAADEGDDWAVEETWQKANPNYGVSVKPEYLKAQSEKAATQPSFLNTFLRLHLDRWTQQRDRWLTIEHWNACEADLARAEYEQREVSLLGMPCYGAFDLSTKLDISALVLFFPDTNTLLCRFWVPEENIMERARRDRVPYDAWVRDGWLKATHGNVIDYEFIKQEVIALAARYDLREIGFDPWNATQIATQLGGDEGLALVEVRQGYKTLSEPAKEFEKLVVSKALRHGGHPVLRWMVSNVAIRTDPNGNIAPDKAASSDRIDGVVASIMALSRAIVAPVDTDTGWLLDLEAAG
jgi:phage terminase large subunit-like protein